jgi:hypothetical protein
MAVDSGEEKKGFFGRLLEKLGGWKGAVSTIGCAIIGSMILPGAGFFIGAAIGAGGAYLVKKRAEKKERIQKMGREPSASSRGGWGEEPKQEHRRGQQHEISARDGYIGGKQLGADSFGAARREHHGPARGAQSYTGRGSQRSSQEDQPLSEAEWRMIQESRATRAPSKTPKRSVAQGRAGGRSKGGGRGDSW